MSRKLVTDERLAELYESARYANAHGNGQVTLKADELLEVLPPLPTPEAVAQPGEAYVETHVENGVPNIEITPKGVPEPPAGPIPIPNVEEKKEEEKKAEPEKASEQNANSVADAGSDPAKPAPEAEKPPEEKPAA